MHLVIFQISSSGSLAFCFLGASLTFGSSPLESWDRHPPTYKRHRDRKDCKEKLACIILPSWNPSNVSISILYTDTRTTQSRNTSTPSVYSVSTIHDRQCSLPQHIHVFYLLVQPSHARLSLRLRHPYPCPCTVSVNDVSVTYSSVGHTLRCGRSE